MMAIQKPDWFDTLLDWLAPVTVHTRSLVFDFGDTRNVPEDWEMSTLRGVWGNALHEIDLRLYDAVFQGPGGKTNRQPLYSVREDLDSAGRPRRLQPWERSLQWSVFCLPDSLDEPLLEAWDLACRDGIGRNRNTCEISHVETYSRELLDPAFIRAAQPCRLVFIQPLRLIKKDAMNPNPTLRDIVLATLTRLGFLRAVALSDDRENLVFPPVPSRLHPDFAPEILDYADTIPGEPWTGIPNSLDRYSGRQKKTISLKGTSGMLTFPQGLGALAPLMAAASTTHLGKGSVYGMGRPFLLW